MFLSEYIRLSDVMHQSLKVYKYNIFENALKERGELLKSIEDIDDLFLDIEESEKEIWRNKIKDLDEKTENAMRDFKKHLEKDLSKIHASQAKLRKHSKVKNYYVKDYGNQGVFIDKSK